MPKHEQRNKSTSKTRLHRPGAAAEPQRDDIAASIERAIRSQLDDLASLDANALARLTIALERIERRDARRGVQPSAASSASDIDAVRAAITDRISKMSAAAVAADPEAERRKLRRALADISRLITRRRDAERKRDERSARDALKSRLSQHKGRQRAGSMPAPAPETVRTRVPPHRASPPTIEEVQDAIRSERFSPAPRPLTKG